MTVIVVPGFRPAVHGLHFPNAFPPGPTIRLGPFDPRVLGIGDAAAGLCGGMALTARDLFEAGLPAPVELEPPANGSPRFRALVRRQVESLDWLRVPLRYFDLQARGTGAPRALGRILGREPARVVAATRELSRIRGTIADGHPAVVGLVRASGVSPRLLARNHQVLAWSWLEEGEASGPGGGTVTLGLYDPNHPYRDDVTVRIGIDEADGRPLRDRITIRQSTGEPVLGLFLQPYPGPRSVKAWRSS